MSFYNAYTRSIISYGLLIYGSAARTNLSKLLTIEVAQRQIISAILFKTKYNSLQNILRQKELNTVFESFIVDLFREIVNQLRST